MYPQKDKQQELWIELLNIMPTQNEPWLIIGDFNCIINLSEKSSGVQRINKYMINFSEFLNQGQLVSLPTFSFLYWPSLQPLTSPLCTLSFSSLSTGDIIIYKYR